MDQEDLTSQRGSHIPATQNGPASNRAGENNYAKNNLLEIPTLNIPNGGGAIKSIDEKFTVNSVNGTAAFSIPLLFSPARGASCRSLSLMTAVTDLYAEGKLYKEER